MNVHPAKTEVRFRRSAAVADAVRESVRAALAAAGYVREEVNQAGAGAGAASGISSVGEPRASLGYEPQPATPISPAQLQSRMEFASLMSSVEEALEEDLLESTVDDVTEAVSVVPQTPEEAALRVQYRIRLKKKH